MKKILSIAAGLFLTIAAVFAEETSPWAFSLTTDLAYYPLSAPVDSVENHFAPITGPYKGLEARTTAWAEYKIPTPFGDNPLTKGNRLVLKGAFELSPVTVSPKLQFNFTPIAFIVLSGGVSVTSGWNLPFLGAYYSSSFNPLNMQREPVAGPTYDPETPFSDWLFNSFVGGTFQFDTGAVWPGDWHHIVLQAYYEIKYNKLLGADSQIYEFQNTYGRADGWMNYQCYTIGYQMPTILSLVGFRAELESHYNGADFGEYDKNFKGNFTEVNLSPVLVFNLGKNDTLFTLINFAGRRGYEFNPPDRTPADEIPMTTKGTEYYFKRLAFSWQHRF